MARLSMTRFLLLCLTVIVISCMHLLFKCNNKKEEIRTVNFLQKESIHLSKDIQSDEENIELEKNDTQELPDDTNYLHKLAVIIPFRERFDELMEFAPWMHKFLTDQGVRHKIVVVNQVDIHRFNRASLINIGYIKSREECDYMVMHDVDLLPNNPDLKYTFPEKGVHHLASPDIHPIYHYAKYVGGVLMLKMSDFSLCRGMSNIFWGWGREDDEFYMRMKENNLPLLRPTGIKTGYNTFKHIHDKVKRPRDYKRYGSQKQVQFKRDPTTGVDTVQYTLISQKQLMIDGAPVMVYNVELYCDTNKTPWCDHDKTK